VLPSVFDMSEEPVMIEESQPDPALVPPEPLPPIESRFLFVDVAALRAKQLRRGARIRFEADPGAVIAKKPERIAMEEVRRGLVYYDVPQPKPARAEGEA
jgi:DNA-directed RNA polymerase omega subunit